MSSLYWNKALTQEEVDNRIEEWHDLDGQVWESLNFPELHEYLLWTLDEYAQWFYDGTLPKE